MEGPRAQSWERGRAVSQGWPCLLLWSQPSQLPAWCLPAACPTCTLTPLRTPSWLGFKLARVSVSLAASFWASQHHCTHTRWSPSYPVSPVIPASGRCRLMAPPGLVLLLPVHWQMEPRDKDIRNPLQQATSLNSFLHPTGGLLRPSWRTNSGC